MVGNLKEGVRGIFAVGALTVIGAFYAVLLAPALLFKEGRKGLASLFIYHKCEIGDEDLEKLNERLTKELVEKSEKIEKLDDLFIPDHLIGIIKILWIIFLIPLQFREWRATTSLEARKREHYSTVNINTNVNIDTSLSVDQQPWSTGDTSRLITGSRGEIDACVAHMRWKGHEAAKAVEYSGGWAVVEPLGRNVVGAEVRRWLYVDGFSRLQPGEIPLRKEKKRKEKKRKRD